MRRTRFCFAQTLMMLAAVFLGSGCGDGGPPKHVVKGKITNGGSVLVVKMNPVSKAGGNLMVWLANDQKARHDAVIDFDTGTFVIDGGDRKGILPGKYKVCVEWFDDYPGGPDKLKGRFNEKNSKIVRDIPSVGELVIDVSKPEG